MNAFRTWFTSVVVAVTLGLIFISPFVYIVLTSMMDRKQANQLTLAWPRQFQLWKNIVEVFQTRDFVLVVAFINSMVITVVSVALMVIFAAMSAYVMQRRNDKFSRMANFFVLAGLIMPPAIIPTVWLLQKLHLFKTISGIILIEVAYGVAFCIIIFRGFIATIPRELDEAAIVDGAGPIRLFFTVIFPLIRPAIATAVIVQSVTVFNDFVNPLYYLPSHPTVQLTLYNFHSQYNTAYNLLFTNILLITIPMLILFLLFSRQMVSGMTAGAVKG